MRPGQNKQQRMRGRNPGNNRRGPNPLTRSYESNGPDVKIRGTAHHVGEKYLQLARDAQTSGDPVMAESYLQHAEHYFRIIAAAQLQQLQAQEGYVRPEGEVEEPEEDDLVGGLPDRFASPVDRAPPAQAFVAQQPSFGQPAPYQPRQQGNGPNPYQPQHQERPQPERPQPERAAIDRQQPEGGPERPYDDRPRERTDDERPRFNRPQRQDRYQPNRYGQDRGQDRNQDRSNAPREPRPDMRQDARPDTRQDRDFRPDRDRQDRDRQDRQPGNRPEQRDNRPPRDFRGRPEANGDREPRAFTPAEPPEAPILPSFITAPTRIVAPVEPLAEPMHGPAANEAGAPEAEFPAVDRSRRRRPRPSFDEQAPEPHPIAATDAPGGSD